VFVVWVQRAAAQSPGDVYVLPGVAFPHQAELGPGSAPPFPAPGGETVGWLVGGGMFLTSRLSIEIEASRTGTMESSHTGRHNIDQSATRRDWFLSAGLKRHFGPSAFRIQPIAGIVLVGDEGTYENTYRSFFANVAATVIRGYYPTDWVPGVMLGVDFHVGSRRLALTPGFRLAFTGVPTGVDCFFDQSSNPECREGAERWSYLHPQWTRRPSIALKVAF